MKSNYPTTQLDPRLVRAFAQKIDSVYFRMLKKKCFERVVFFQPALKNIRKIGNIEVDSYLLPYLSKTVQVSLGAAEKSAVWRSIEKGVYFSSSALAVKSMTTVKNCKFANRFDSVLAVQSFAQKIDSVIESNSCRMQQEAFWRLKVKYDRVDEAKVFLLSLKYTLQKIQMRRLYLFASAKTNTLKNSKDFQPRVMKLESLFQRKFKGTKKEAMQILKINKRTYDYYESIYQEQAPDIKRCSIKIIGEFDNRPNSFSAIVNKRADLLRVLLLFRTIHMNMITRPKTTAMQHFWSQMKALPKKKPSLSIDKASRGLKFIFRIIQSRRINVWKTLVKLPPAASLKAKILISHVIEKVELKTRIKNYSPKTVNMLSIVLQEITKHRKMVAWQILRSYYLRMQSISQKEKILYAKVEHIKRNPTMGTLMLGETTPIPSSPRGFTTTYINEFQPPASSRIGIIISICSPPFQNRW